jgi:hypothetical protein
MQVVVTANSMLALQNSQTLAEPTVRTSTTSTRTRIFSRPRTIRLVLRVRMRGVDASGPACGGLLSGDFSCWRWLGRRDTFAPASSGDGVPRDFL